MKSWLTIHESYDAEVAPFAGAWIEIIHMLDDGSPVKVAPFAGAWIEIFDSANNALVIKVAPFAGAWIEISGGILALIIIFVAPFAGAWIEIIQYDTNCIMVRSLPSRERGLKYCSFVTILSTE